MYKVQTTEELVRLLFDWATYPINEMTIEMAERDLDAFRAEGWDLPADVTAEEYAYLWNWFREESIRTREEALAW